MTKIEKPAKNRAGSRECRHQYTFKLEYLYQDVNVIFSKKTCEKCGKQIVLSRQSKIHVILFVVILVLLLFFAEMQLKHILPEVSYTAKALVVVLAFCFIVGIGLYQLMNRATYVTYVPRQTSSQYREAYEQARRENDERTRQRYEEAVRRREEKRRQKEARKKQ
ncbi:MAG: hypothetical protein IJ109_04310 [Firmicutes bacterium]|nr:hypothetical protein [Bacillota bacterium]